MDVRSGRMRTLFAVCMAAAWVQQGKGASCSAQEAGLNGCSSGLMQVRALDSKTRASTQLRKLGEDVKKMIDRNEIVENSTVQELRDLVDTWSKEIEEEVAGVKTKAQKYVADVAKNVSEHYTLKNMISLAQDAHDEAESLAQSMASKEYRFDLLRDLDSWKRDYDYITTEYLLSLGYAQKDIDDSIGYADKTTDAEKKNEVSFATAHKRLETFKHLCTRFAATKYHCTTYAGFYETQKTQFETQMGLFEKTIDEANDEEATRKKVSCYIDTFDKTKTQTVVDCENTPYNGTYTFTKGDMPGKENCDDTGLEKVSQDYGEKYTPKDFKLDSGDYAGVTTTLRLVPLKTAYGDNIFTREKVCEGLEISYSGGGNGKKGKCDHRGSKPLYATEKTDMTEACRLACNLDESCLGFDIQTLGDSTKCTWYEADEGDDCQALGQELSQYDDTRCYVKMYNANFTNPCPKATTIPKPRAPPPPPRQGD